MSFADDPRRLSFTTDPRHDALELASSRDPSVPLREQEFERQPHGSAAQRDASGREAGREQAAREGVGRDGSPREHATSEGSARDKAERDYAAAQGGASREGASRDNAGDRSSRRERSATGPSFAPDQTESEQAAAREQIFNRGQQWTKEQAVRDNAARAASHAVRAGQQGTARDPAREAAAGAAREAAARANAARESAARDGVARDNAARESAARDNAARESAARDNAARGGAARDNAARDGAARDSAAAREGAQRGQLGREEHSPARAAKYQPHAHGRLVEERAARTKADPRRDPTLPHDVPIRPAQGRVARGGEEIIRQPRGGVRDARQPANANDPRLYQGAPRTAAAQQRDRNSNVGSGPRTAAERVPQVTQDAPPPTAARSAEQSGNAKARATAASDAQRSLIPPGGAAQGARAVSPDGRKFPSQPGASAPDPRTAATPDGRKFPSQHGASAPDPRTAATPDGRKFPSQHGASAPDPRTAATTARPDSNARGPGASDRANLTPDGRKFPSQHGASAPDPRTAATTARPDSNARGPGTSDRANLTPDGRKFPSQHGASAPEPRAAAVDGRRFPSTHGAAAPEPRASTPDGRRYPSEPGSRTPANAPSLDNRRSAEPQNTHVSRSTNTDPRRSPGPAGADTLGIPRRALAAHGGGHTLRSIRPQRDSELYCEIDGLAVEIQTQDLSAGGLFVQTPSPPPIDSEVAVFLRIRAFKVEASGHVVQSMSLDASKRERRRPGFGLLFTEIDDNVRSALRDAIEALNTEHAEQDYEFSRPPTNPDIALEAAHREAARAAAQPAQSRSNEHGRARSIEPATRESHEQIAERVTQPAKPQPAAPPDPQEQELLAKLKAELAAVESQPPWTVLGISQGADEATARTAFFAASKRYHPHAYARYALPEIKAVVTKLFIVYKRAFTTMTKNGRGGGRNAARAAGSGNPPLRSSDPGNR